MAEVVKASDYYKKNSKAKKTSTPAKKTTSSKSKIDLSGIKKIIDDNPEAVRKIKEGVTDIVVKNVLNKKTTTKKTTAKKSASKNSKSSSSDSLSKVLDLAGSFLKK